MDKYKTCKDCPDRSLTCRKGCDGWLYREQKKKERYDHQNKAMRENPEMRAWKEAEAKKFKHQKEGRK